MLSNVIIFITLFICWFVFSGETSAFFLLAGVFSSLVGLGFAIRTGLVQKLNINIDIWRYLSWLAAQAFLSALDVAQRVWGLKPIKPQFVLVPTSQNLAIGFTILGNSITLTPGTVTVNINTEKRKVLVHAISNEAVVDLKNGRMDKKVKKITGHRRKR